MSELGRVPPAVSRRIIGGVAVTMLLFGRFVLIPAFLAVFSNVRFAKPLNRHATTTILHAATDHII